MPHCSASAMRPGVLNQRMCAAGEKQWTQQLYLIFYWARKRRDRSSQDTSSSGASSLLLAASQQELSHHPSCLPIVLPANPPGVQSQPKHYRATSPFCSENLREENKAWLSHITYAHPVLHLFLTQPAQLRCDAIQHD